MTTDSLRSTFGHHQSEKERRSEGDRWAQRPTQVRFGNDADGNNTSINSNNDKLDCRSILNNKQQLKRFWERRMELEMEFKLASGAAQTNHDAMRKAATKMLPTKTETEPKTNDDDDDDENNNNCSDHNNNNEMQTRKQVEQQQFQSSQFSDDEWRSLSPRAPDVGKTDEEHGQQLMSIDPTLCHSTDDLIRRGSCGVGQVEELEEQQASEEFNSTSSSSSFGPMSISLGGQQKNEAEGMIMDESMEAETETEEPNSNQSGSVLTVIDQHEELRNLSSEASSSEASGEVEVPEDASNIGVAFESLQFDDEIKSARQEEVDDELLLIGPTQMKQPKELLQKDLQAPAASKRSNLVSSSSPSKSSKFDAGTVKSVCNFITAAICDATKQVELVNTQKSLMPATETQPAKVEPEINLDVESSGLQRATFVQEEGEAEEASLVTEVHGEPAEEVPKADLSSIFEANVRREIERFETNSSRNSRAKAGSQGKSGLTEWRIAEEIRLFNERELELKRRFVSQSEQTEDSNPTKQDEDASARFGKALQVARSQQAVNGRAQASIKLSTTSNSTGTTSISMHKFISSGGKRFVFTSTSSTCNGNQKLQSKSMSNLNNSGSCVSGQKSISKETALVKPGIARKAIETFRRFQTTDQTSQQQQQQQQQQLAGNNTDSSPQNHNHNPSSAEWKIQEELREMRAREQELRKQRQMANKLKMAENGFRTGIDHEDERDEDQVQPLEKISNSNQDERLSFSSESLYPIKQTIAEFRKFSVATVNSSSNSNASATSSRPQRARPQTEEDYESKVGGQRRKISMIERWENGIGR